jgi:hypothetical protein
VLLVLPPGERQEEEASSEDTVLEGAEVWQVSYCTILIRGAVLPRQEFGLGKT